MLWQTVASEIPQHSLLLSNQYFLDIVEGLDYKEFAIQRDKNETKGCAPKSPPGPLEIPATSIPKERTHVPSPMTIEDDKSTSLCTFLKNIFLQEIMACRSAVVHPHSY